ncbi:MAG: tryptophan--tRNA ligase [Candidatus Gastranaerophilales bacterium]|nr:tryptophan--tRNA ligase [Candidatus Gastranaerophilales bacterium]
MQKEKLMSGMRPTGKLHLGHYMGVLTNWVKLQDEFNCFYCVADWHALTTKYDKTEALKQDRLDVVLDWLACGINPDSANIYFQSQIPQIAELHILLSMITPNNWVERDPTLKDMVKILKGKDGANKENIPQVNYGLLGYPVLMTADILAFNAAVVPVGTDQLAHLEISRDIARRFNNIYNTDFFIEPAPKLTQIPLLKGVDGQKMGKSFNNDIKISDDEETTAKKVMRAITDRSRARKDDPGHPDKCEVAYSYYSIFGNEELQKVVADECIAGSRGCADCKRQLAKVINEKFAPIRAKRLEYANDMDKVYDILNEGNKKARCEAESVMEKVRDIVGIAFK